MQIFIVGTPLETAEALDPKRLRSQINECAVILRAIRGESDAWNNHPIVKQFKNHYKWLFLYNSILELYRDGFEGSMAMMILRRKADAITPDFLTSEFIDQHKRRLYTKNPAHYEQWAELGTSDENWYSVEGEILKYCNGKRI